MTQQILNAGKWFVTAKVLWPIIVGLVVFLWSIGQDDLRDSLQEFSGMNSLEETIVAQNRAINRGFEDAKVERASLKANIDRVEQRVAAFEPEPQIAEFDLRRSKVLDAECFRGSHCEYKYRARRTDYGLPCELRNNHPFVIDSYGDKHPARIAVPDVRNIDDEWNIIRNRFFVPEEAALEEAEFIIELRYACPTPNGGTRIVKEATEPLEFIIGNGKEHP